jgi:hypothetical protein
VTKRFDLVEGRLHAVTHGNTVGLIEWLMALQQVRGSAQLCDVT